jgi:hypothetical protein
LIDAGETKQTKKEKMANTELKTKREKEVKECKIKNRKRKNHQI